MAFVEMMNIGIPSGSPGSALCTLGRSPGITDNLANEITRFCQGWGPRPVNEKMRPALLSFPMKSSARFAPQGAYAIIRVDNHPDFHFQAAVISRSDYAVFGYNPFAVVSAGAFGEWSPGTIPGRRTLAPPDGPMQVSPPPSPEDVGLIDEALVQLLDSHKLYLPIEKTVPQSDRFLALLVEVLPEALKQQLRFASFAPSPNNGYHLAATETHGCDYAGWHRLLMSLVSSVLPDHLDRYVKKVRDCLAYGDVSVIKNDGRLLSIDQTMQPTPTGPMPTPKVKPAKKRTTTNAAMPRSIPVRLPHRQNGPETTRPHMAHLRGDRRRLSAPVVVLLVLALTLGGGWVYLEFFHGGSGIDWGELVSWPGEEKSTGSDSRRTSLLEAPNVGAIYDRQIKRIKRATMIPGINLGGDENQHLAKLKSEAAVPLMQQLDLFCELASGGIRQGERPDRENERMRALAHQGQVLTIELARLELAWCSLSSGTNWQDLSRLSDRAVLARRDSLQKKSPSALKAAGKDLQLGNRSRKLDYAVGQAKGMSQLLELFQAESYSKEWARRLNRAAENVSPSASPMTRAYRNSAFIFVRLKNAEMGRIFEQAAFAPEWDGRRWPAPAVASLLPRLRREVGKFASNEAPSVLAGTLALYQILEEPEPILEKLAEGKTKLSAVQDNPAYRFHREVYNNYLERLRYQAALRTHPDRRDEKDLYSATGWEEVLSFESVRKRDASVEQWEALGSASTTPFLKRWAHRMKEKGQQDLLATMGKFEEDWSRSVDLSEQMITRAGNGEDWTALWVDLKTTLDRALTLGAGLKHLEGIHTGQMALLRQLDSSLHRSAVLDLGQVTARLEQQRLNSPVQVVCDFQVLPDGPVLSSQPFTLGPAAPAGSGWVGTVPMNHRLSMGPEESFRTVIRTVDGNRELLEIVYPCLAERVGPGALSRPRSSEHGSLSIKTDIGWWQSLELPRLVSGPGAS